MDYTKRTNILWASTTELVTGHANSTTVHPFYHLLYVRYGEGIFRCDDTSYNVSKGTCILVRPQIYHEIPAENHNLMGFHEIKFEIRDSYLSENLEKIQPIFTADPLFETALLYICDNYTQIEDKDIVTNVDCLLSSLLTLMFLGHALPPKASSQYIVGSKYNNTTQKIIKYIEKHALEDVNLKQMGEYLEMHPNYLCASFKKHTGHSIIEYLNYVRIMEVVKTIYFRPKTPLNEIAFICGFGSVSNFNRAFKKFTKTTPSILLNYFEYNSDTSSQSAKQIHDILIIERFSSIEEAFDKLGAIAQIISNTTATNA